MAANEGVYSVAIDMAEGLVQIGGKDNLDPSILIKTVATAGKRAHLQSVEKTTAAAAAAAVDSGQPSNPSGNATDESCNNTGRSQNGNSGSGHFSDRGGRYGQIHINEAAAVKPPPRNWPFMRPPLQFGGVGFGGSRGLRPLLPPPMVPMPPPVPPLGYYRWSELPPHGYNQPEPPPEVPPAYGYCWLPEPPPEAPSCWQQHPPPIVNAPEHYLFSDENIEGCTVV